MAGSEVIQVHPLSEVRARLSGILARFRSEGAAAEPIAFGSHRKPEAILIPYETYERYEALARQRARLDNVLSAAQSVQVELQERSARSTTARWRLTWTGRSVPRSYIAGRFPATGGRKCPMIRTPIRRRACCATSSA